MQKPVYKCSYQLGAQTVKIRLAVQETWVSIPGLGRSPGGGHGNPLQYSRLENAAGRGAWWATVHGVAQSCLTVHSANWKQPRCPSTGKGLSKLWSVHMSEYEPEVKRKTLLIICSNWNEGDWVKKKKSVPKEYINDPFYNIVEMTRF